MSFEHSGDQLSVIDSLARFIWDQPQNDSPLSIVQGFAGTGKSFVLRCYARELSLQVLNGGGNVVPLFIPLQEFRDADPAKLWDHLFVRYAAWASHTSAAGYRYTAGDLDSRLGYPRVVVILDSVDEFLMNHPKIASGMVERMIQLVRQRFRRTPPNVAFVLGIRMDEPVVLDLIKHADHVHTIDLVTLEQAREHFPGSIPVIEKVLERNDIETEDIVRRPVILRVFRDRADAVVQVKNAELANPSGILIFALETIIRSSRPQDFEFPTVPDPGGTVPTAIDSTTVEDWLDALTIFAAVYSSSAAARGGVGSVSYAEVAVDAARIEDAWERHAWPNSDEARKLRTRLKRGFVLLKDRDAFLRLVTRTVFLPSGEGRHRFQHRLWQDLLYGRYFSICIEAVELLELTRYSFTLDAYRNASEILRGPDNSERKIITKEFMEECIKAFDTAQGQIMVGNIGGFMMPAGPTGIDDAAIVKLREYFLDHEANRRTCVTPEREYFSKAGDLTLYCALCYRLISRDLPVSDCWTSQFVTFVPIVTDLLGVHLAARRLKWRGIKDSMSDKLMAHVTPMMERYLAFQDPPAGESITPNAGMNKLLRSVAWCFFTAYSEKFDQQLRPAGPWPRPVLTESEEKDLMDRSVATWDIKNDVLSINPLNEMVQVAYLTNQSAILNEPLVRALTMVNYLFIVSLAVKHGCSGEAIRKLLPEQMAVGSPYRTVYENYPFAPVQELYRQCLTNSTSLLAREATNREV